MAKDNVYKWKFKPRFRRNAFGWRSQPAIQRVKQAVAEIKKVARTDPLLAADGAVIFLERVSPALEQIDSSSGAIGAAVSNAIEELATIIASAPADEKTREAWLERLWAAHEADEIPYIETLADYWGDLCASHDVASQWADQMLDATRAALSPSKERRPFFDGTSACLSALFSAGRFAEIIDLLQGEEIWPYKKWAVQALLALGKKSEALRYAESCRGPYTNDPNIDVVCEDILLSSGLADEAYERYGLVTNRRSTYLATFRAVAKKYPHKKANEILADLVKSTPGQEGKWFAAAKEAKLYDEALALAARSPCDPKTLARAARDLADKQPTFAVGAGLLAIRWLVEGYGYEISSEDVWAAFESTMKSAAQIGIVVGTRDRVASIVASEKPAGFVTRVLGKELGL